MDAIFLQPVPKWLAEDRVSTVDPDYQAFSENVLERCGPSVHDFQSALGGLGSEFAMSVEEAGVHYSDAAAQVLADEIATALLAVRDSE